ncbi:hypothetical protein BSIN_2443 [Burkholderia singularis]|uniref:Uncharacterized protein n=1 Tax=Burkholderia singularis TaxID=1503053 RepID=A0A238H1Y3_9BURK|nr:hypothetical protein BSIN_2443 [Burkholderia singularis]
MIRAGLWSSTQRRIGQARSSGSASAHSRVAGGAEKRSIIPSVTATHAAVAHPGAFGR